MDINQQQQQQQQELPDLPNIDMISGNPVDFFGFPTSNGSQIKMEEVGVKEVGVKEEDLAAAWQALSASQAAPGGGSGGVGLEHQHLQHAPVKYEEEEYPPDMEDEEDDDNDDDDDDEFSMEGGAAGGAGSSKKASGRGSGARLSGGGSGAAGLPGAGRGGSGRGGWRGGAGRGGGRHKKPVARVFNTPEVARYMRGLAADEGIDAAADQVCVCVIVCVLGSQKIRLLGRAVLGVIGLYSHVCNE
jgi:hypothetical protein